VVYGSKIEVTAITEIYNMSVSVYFVSQTKSLHHRTVTSGQVVTERTDSIV
jgi:hypothetical protein